MKSVNPFCWESLDDSCLKVFEKIVEDKGQGGTKECEPFEWYHHPKCLTSIKQSCVKLYSCHRFFLSELLKNDDFVMKHLSYDFLF